MDRLKIAIACRQVSGVSGTTTTILEQAQRLGRLGWEVHVYGESLDTDRIEAAGAIAHRLPRWPWGSYFKRRLFAWNCERAFKRRNFDLVCGHGEILSQDVLSLHNCVHAAHEAAHGRPHPETGVARLHREILEGGGFRLLIANSELMKRELIRRFSLREEAVAVIYPGHDPSRFTIADREKLGAPLRSQIGAKPSEAVLGLITSGDFAKRGAAVFLRALALLSPAAKARTRALIVGQESRLKPYRRLAAESGLGSRILFLSPSRDIPAAYHALDVYVHPAYYEEFGQSVQEAMACGVPVAATRQVGAAELMGPQSRLRLLPRPEPEALSRELETLISDEALRRRLGAENAAACRNNTWDDNFAKTLSRYESLLKAAVPA